MQTATKVLLTGAGVAALILALGKANAYRLHARLEELELACMAEVISHDAPFDVQTPDCDPTVLFWTDSPRQPYRGIRGSLVATQATLWQQDSLLAPLAGAVLAVSAAPWTCRMARLQIGKLRNANPEQ